MIPNSKFLIFIKSYDISAKVLIITVALLVNMWKRSAGCHSIFLSILGILLEVRSVSYSATRRRVGALISREKGAVDWTSILT
jgi:hypothetical protein